MNSRPNTYYKILTGFILLLIVTVSGCGQKGDLYIPDKPVTMAETQIFFS